MAKAKKVFTAKDGTVFSTAEALQLYEWRSTPAIVKAQAVTYRGLSSDWRTNVWSWACGRCGYDPGTLIDTLFRKYCKTCDKCLADNTFDFSEYGA